MNPARRLIVIGLAAWQAGFSVASAQEGKTTKIHVVFQSYYERVRPGYAEGITTEELTLTLSGANNIQEATKSANALASKVWNATSTLGSYRRRVGGPHRIVGTARHPQSVRTTTIEVNGTTCKASWNEALLPGFQEYNIYSIVLGQYAFYRQARMESSTCEIESS
ncbi:MAG TPA: hypothetical protein VKS78_07385 [Roseiarcus sp.]|nr:hypothetical protein [Roseiarcus sp.]